MKKSLLLAVALLSTAAGFAQTQEAATKVKAPKLPTLMMRQKALNLDLYQAAPAVRHSVTTQNYYTRPDGTLYRGWGFDGYGTLFTVLEAPIGSSITFTQAGTVNATWKQAGSAVAGASGNSFSFEVPFSSSFYAPVLSYRTDSFSVGTNSFYAMGLDRNDSRFNAYRDYSSYIHWGMIGADSIQRLLPVDDHAGLLYEGRLYTNQQGWGALSSDNMYGTGYVDYAQQGAEGIGDCYAVDQPFGKTSGPLYVERIGVMGYTATQPIKNNGQLIALVTGVREISLNDGSTQKVADLNAVYDTLYATANDTLGFDTSDPVQRNGKNVYEGTVFFSKKVVDDFGTEVEAPFVIPANTDFAIYLTGFQDTTNVDFGPIAYNYPEEETDQPGHFYTQLRGEDGGYRHYYDHCAVAVGIQGMYDGVLAPEHPGFYTFENEALNYNTVKISDDGQTTLTDGATASATNVQGADGLPGAFVVTTVDFFDGDDNPNYAINDLPDWIQNVQVMELDPDYHTYILGFVADALPAGTSKRAATVHITSDKGAVSGPIYLLQGDATVADGINAASVENVNKAQDNRIFNLAGQQVSKSFKGIVIENGKKHIQ